MLPDCCGTWLLLAFYFVWSLKVKMVGTLNGEQKDANINLDLSPPLALQIKKEKEEGKL